jgi:hypothetical protein
MPLVIAGVAVFFSLIIFELKKANDYLKLISLLLRTGPQAAEAKDTLHDVIADLEGKPGAKARFHFPDTLKPFNDASYQ